jgi:integrase
VLPIGLQIVLSLFLVAEARALLARMEGPPKLVAALLYGGGLRLLEARQLRVKDIDFDRR